MCTSHTHTRRLFVYVCGLLSTRKTCLLVDMKHWWVGCLLWATLLAVTRSIYGLCVCTYATKYRIQNKIPRGDLYAHYATKYKTRYNDVIRTYATLQSRIQRM